MSTGGGGKEVVKGTVLGRWCHCLRGPSLVRTLVVVVCAGVVVRQLYTCVRKLSDKPVTTYTHFEFNQTLLYPSVTLCREPPYKFNRLLEHGLYGHPQYTSAWTAYDFRTPLDDLWEDATYNMTDVFVQYGLDGSPDNVEVEPIMTFMLGRCYTLSPRLLLRQASRASGYSAALQHAAADFHHVVGVNTPGYHVFVHYRREPFTEVTVHSGGLVEYLYLASGEELGVKVTVDQYEKISRDHDVCTHDAYSSNQCTTDHVWRRVEEEAGCSGPWMRSRLPRCANYSATRDLIVSYMKHYAAPGDVACPRFCRSYLYNAFVTNRREHLQWGSAGRSAGNAAALQSQLYVHFNSMMVSVYEERYNYDWSLFLSDIGGSVGFLLGLSVISLMTIFTKVWTTIISPFIVKKEPGAVSAAASASTADISKQDEFVEKFNDWKIRNDKLEANVAT